MRARVIDGAAEALRVRDEVAAGVTALTAEGGPPPGLATVLIGDDPASQVYIRSKRRACTAAGMVDLHQHLPADVSQEAAAALLDRLAADPAVSGILLRLPVPGHLDAEALLGRIPAAKDVDGLTTTNAGLLAQGRPMAQLLLQRDATVTPCHSRTRELAAVCRRADVLVVAAGIPRLIGADAVKPGAVVVDVGMHRVDGALVGDVDAEAVSASAGALTPVRGGVGPMTIALLLSNTLDAARAVLGDGVSTR
ncbi:bifunctional 5,10-methylenetetrahydrofolate dehydrogenase/5,10-methenyltetrahydrofolate cyclohydrolase [Kineococcus sp. LSe6-4]|uniref:Bifunctional protein FolD n=1 Tax=Kineococcus halophytocola TaxID=3234027 RepID=A0ABV4H3X1_9ACTN